MQLSNGVDASTVTNLDVDISMLTSSLLLRISKGESTILARLMMRLVEKLHRDMTTSLSGVAKVPIPSSKNELRRFMDGKVAVLNNVPIPLVRETINGCYVLPSDFLRLYFCFGVLEPHMIKCVDDIEYSTNEISTIWQSKKARECLQNLEINDDSTYKILLSEWSDGFDPNSTSKNNRGSIHITSFSLLGHQNRNDHNLSFPSTISNDNSNHIDIRRIVYDDLKNLRKPTEFWIGKEFIKVQVIHFLTIQDRPERTKATGHGYHNAKYSGRWGWISVFDNLLLSCEACHGQRCNNVATNASKNRCRSCYDWNYDKITFSLPDDYLTNKKTSKCHQITFGGMKEAVTTAHSKLLNKTATRWVPSAIKISLVLEGINVPLINSIMNCKTVDELKTLMALTAESYVLRWGLAAP